MSLDAGDYYIGIEYLVVGILYRDAVLLCKRFIPLVMDECLRDVPFEIISECKYMINVCVFRDVGWIKVL